MRKLLKMQEQNNRPTEIERGTLKDFVPLVLSFLACLVLLSCYQNVRLYIDGVLDGFLNRSLFLLILHHLGFAALVGLILAFVFNILEGKKAGLGLKTVKIILVALLVLEGLLIEYYVREYEILEGSTLKLAIGSEDLLPTLSVVSIGTVLYFVFSYLHKRMARVYRVVSRMYPFTIILFSLFLGILNSDKKPINENKTQHFVVSVVEHVTDLNTYEGSKEYPLVKPYQMNDVLGEHFSLQQKKPNIVVLIIEGFGADFIGKNATYAGFTPYLNSLSEQSLYWENFLSNSGVGFPALTSIMGSLPFGEAGFTNADRFIHRQTLFGLLKKNGYRTGFYYGGNSALHHFDKFLEEESVDVVLDKKGFGVGYELQEKDAAGITLGYPDKALFSKWAASNAKIDSPSFEVFYTLSTKKPYLVPEFEILEKRVQDQLTNSGLSNRQKRLVRKNSEIFASLTYMDDAIGDFMTSYTEKPEYSNTIFIITGSHNLTDLPQYDELGRYKVPLMIFSPMLKEPKLISTLASHVDIAPSLVHLLDNAFEMEVPKTVAWLGDGLRSNAVFDTGKAIPLFRDTESIKDYIVGNQFITKRKSYTLGDKLQLLDANDALTDNLRRSFKEFKAINAYVLERDKIIPKKNSLVALATPEFSKTDLIWIESEFNGKDFDNAYSTAKELAFDNEWDRSLLLCTYILSEIPGHVDTEILMGRIYAWKTDFARAEGILEKAVQKYPVYEDGYAALFDVYFWTDQPQKAIALEKVAEKNKVQSTELNLKIDRAKAQLKKADNKEGLVTLDQ